MSDLFREREKGFEAKFEQDEALRFRILTRRNKLFGLWVAGEIGLGGAEAEAYARDLVEFDLVHGTPEAIVDKAHSDLKDKGVEFSRHRLDLRAVKLLHEAEAMIQQELVSGAF